MPIPVPEHQQVVGNTYVFLRDLSKEHGGRCFMAPLEIYLDDDNVSQPDV